MSESLQHDPTERKRILAASAPWLAAALNVLPGLGTGYIYQRRWMAYWITVSLGALWVGLDAMALEARLLGGELEMGAAVPGLLALALVTAAEAFLAARRARMN